MVSKRAYGWCFTLNNYSEEDYSAVLELPCSYLIVGKEIGESGTPHLQGYIQFVAPGKTFVACRKLLPRAHWEERSGTIPQAIQYCKKEGSFIEVGTPPLTPKEKGAVETDRWRDAVNAYHKSDFASIPSDILVRHSHGLARAAQLLNPFPLPTLDTLKTGVWIHGPTECGKSSKARQDYPNPYIKDPKTEWWTNYSGEPYVLIEDFDVYQKAQGGDMKRWLDRYPFQARVHGGQMLIRPELIIVTSQYHPSEIWDDQRTVDAIVRRCTMIDMNPQKLYSLFETYKPRE